MTQYNSSFWTCSHCGAKNYEGDRCPYCDSPRTMEIPVNTIPSVSDQQPPVQPQMQKEVRKGGLLQNNPLITVILVAGIALVCAVGFLLSKRMGSDSESAPVSANTENTGNDTGSVSSDGSITAVDGYAAGEIGDVMRNAFFDFTVNSVEVSDSYGSYEADDDCQLIIVNLTIKNTMDQELPMYDTDFEIIWGDGDDEWEVPITYYDSHAQSGVMLEREYTVGVNTSVTGDLVFEVPEDPERFALVFAEYFDNDEEGDLFAVYFDVTD